MPDEAVGGGGWAAVVFVRVWGCRRVVVHCAVGGVDGEEVAVA